MAGRKEGVLSEGDDNNLFVHKTISHLRVYPSCRDNTLASVSLSLGMFL